MKMSRKIKAESHFNYWIYLWEIWPNTIQLDLFFQLNFCVCVFVLELGALSTESKTFLSMLITSKLTYFFFVFLFLYFYLLSFILLLFQFQIKYVCYNGFVIPSLESPLFFVCVLFSIVPSEFEANKYWPLCRIPNTHLLIIIHSK